MNRSLLVRTCIGIALAACLAVLFSLPYRTVRQRTVANFTSEELLLIRQAVQGIDDIFSMYGRGLRYFADHEAVIGLNDEGRSMLQHFYVIHTPALLSIARLDADGNIQFRVTNTTAITPDALDTSLNGATLGPDFEVKDILCGKERIASFSAAVRDGGKPAGHLVLLVSIDQIMTRFLQPLKTGKGRRTWVIDQDGMVLDCPYPNHSPGHSNTPVEKAEVGTLRGILARMTRTGQNSVPIRMDNPDDTVTSAVTNHVVALPVSLPGGNAWTVAAATPERQVLAHMNTFRNFWLLVSGVSMAAILFLGLFLIRSLTLAREQEERQRVEDQLVELMDSVPIGIIVYDDEGTLHYANRMALQLWRSNTSIDMAGINVLDYIHPDYRSFVGQRFKEVLRGGTSVPAVIKVLLPDNVERHLEICSASIEFAGQRCGVTVMQDVSQRLKIEEEQRRLATAIANTNDSIVITDRNGTIEYVNPAFSRITGYAKEEAIGQNPRFLKSGLHERPFYTSMWNTLLQGKAWEGRLINRRKDGSLYTELASISPVRDATGRISHFVAVKRDITHEVELESQLQQAQKMEAIGTLAGGIAHDFNNILGAIIGFTDLSLLQTKPDSPIHDNLLQIRNSGRRAADLIQQILTFSRQAVDRQKIPVSMASLLKETLKLLRASLPTTIDIQLDLHEPEGWVLADPVQIQQVIMNLCTNAFHAMGAKGGTLTISLERLPLEDCRQTAGYTGSACIEMKVADTGHGIDQAIIDRIFDPFFTTKEPGVGTGMGLSVVHGIITDLDGMITVDSSREGTCFTILIPETVLRTSQAAEGEGDIPHGSESILVVDDEKDIRDTCRMMLQQLGYRVTVCEDPLQALTMIQEDESRFDLVICDQTMPAMTGTELLGNILPIRPDLPVILCTGYSELLTDEKARQLGARLLMMKPINFRQLGEAVRQILDRSGSPEQVND